MARKWWTLLAVSVATFMLLLDITVVNVALPSIRESLGANFTDLQWVVDAYALTLAALVLTAGSLADRIGRRRLFAIGLGIFSFASLLCAISPDPTFLNLARALQGIGGAVMFAVSLALLAQEFPAGRERATAMGIYGASIGVAVAAWPRSESPTRSCARAVTRMRPESTGRVSPPSARRSSCWYWRSSAATTRAGEAR
jgi:MFS family permease